jgi:geranylgeranyl diphosphate synthase type II
MVEASSVAALKQELPTLRSRVDRRLHELVPEETEPPERLHRAIRYSLLAPGKRVRPALTLLAARSFGHGEPQAVLDPACAIEMVHAASLIVDDLPFMDDAQERRGQAASHRAFGLQTATLASLALLNRAFGVLAETEGLSDGIRVDLVRVLARALGDTGGAIAGQEEDLESPGAQLSVPALERMVRHKTGALFVACAETGARVAGAGPEMLRAARSFGWSFGLCFQVMDDLADSPATRDAPGGDQDQGKATFVSVMGRESAWRAAEDYGARAVEALAAVDLGESPLAALTAILLSEGASRGATTDV